MANLQSPGVQVQVIDESFYLPAAPGTTPMIFVTSAQDKTNTSGSTALGTTAANAGKVWLITSQRDLIDTFGTPVFYTDASGNPQHGGELNEYGLQAAYSMLGVSSKAYIVRAGLDTTSLEPSSSAPTGSPVAGTYWIDTDASKYGVKEWNSSTQSFTVKTPIVLDDSSPAASFNGVAPSPTVGVLGDYCMVFNDTTNIQLYVKTSAATWQAVDDSFGTNLQLEISPHYTFPSYNESTATGSVWITTTVPTSGAEWSVKYYSGSAQEWISVPAPMYSGVQQASYSLDSAGGKNIPVGTLFIDADSNNQNNADFIVKRRKIQGLTTVVTNASTHVLGTDTTATFAIRVSQSGVWATWAQISITGNGVAKTGSLVSAGILANTTGIFSNFDNATNKLTITHTSGGDIEIDDILETPVANSGLTTSLPNVYVPPAGDTGDFLISNWAPLVYEAKPTAPTQDAEDGTLWYNSIVDEVDILYHNGSTWVGYRDPVTGLPSTDPKGPIVSAVAPTTQADGVTALATGDIWVSTADLDRYGRDIYVFSTSKEWVLQDVTDQSTPNGWLFADVRWATTGTTLTASSIANLLTSNYLDPDAPDPSIYPKGMKLWNTRRSGFNVKKYVTGHINTDATDGLNQRYPKETGESMGLYKTARWVSQYPVAADGGPQFGRLSQRAQVVNSLKETIDSNSDVRDTDTLVFNLLATPGYPEAIQNMIGLNTDRKLTAFVVGDTPFRLQPTGTALSEWALNTNNALDNGDVGATSYDEYMAMWYPSGYANDNTGNYIVVPPSHMMLRTIINSDNKSYQWFAPAGTRRGGVDNATSVGYITGEGEFKPTALYEGLRDVLYNAKVNPIATLTGVGVVAYGQKTRARNASSLDRINVSRLVVYLRRQLDIMARPYLFEPNDVQTRREIKAAAESLLLELVGQRALYDFIVVCDESNNTSARIDRNELWLDIAIEPVKAVEFIYIPLRLKNTGDIAAGL